MLALLLCRELPRLRQEGLSVPWWRYLLWALADVEANYMAPLAFKLRSKLDLRWSWPIDIPQLPR